MSFDDIMFLIKGMLVGVAIAAPIGPIGILCIKRTLGYGLHAGFLTGFGASTADAFFAIFAGFGITAMSTMIDSNRMYFEFFGGLFLVFLAWRAYVKRAHHGVTDHDDGVKDTLQSDSYAREYFTSLFLTMTNPITIIGIMGLMAAFGVNHETTTVFQTWVMIFGVFAGSALWFIGLTLVIGLLIKHRLSAKQMTNINVFSAGLFLFFAVIVIWDAFLHYQAS